MCGVNAENGQQNLPEMQRAKAEIQKKALTWAMRTQITDIEELDLACGKPFSDEKWARLNLVETMWANRNAVTEFA